MKSLIAWLQRLGTVTHDSGISAHFFRACVYGDQPLNISNWILSAEPQGLCAYHPQALGPESWSVLKVPDAPDQPSNLLERHQLGAEMACLLSLALDRRVAVPIDFTVQIPQLQSDLLFQPAAQIVDQNLLAPLPEDALEKVKKYTAAVAGLPVEHQDVIGAAATAHHGALAGW